MGVEPCGYCAASPVSASLAKGKDVQTLPSALARVMKE